jgi:hypothetical protein
MLACGLARGRRMFAFQRPFREFNGVEYRIGDDSPAPDYQEKTEFAFARLMYPPGEGGINGYYGRDLDWHTGSPTGPRIFPRADRHFRSPSAASPASTRGPSNSASIWMRATSSIGRGSTPSRWASGASPTRRGRLCANTCCAAVSSWPTISTAQFEWNVFEKVIKRAFPDREIRDIPDDDPIFHTVYDLNERARSPASPTCAPGLQDARNIPKARRRQGRALARHLRRPGPHHDRHLLQLRHRRCLGIRGRFPFYPAPFADLAIRLGVNYIVYAMTR